MSRLKDKLYNYEVIPPTNAWDKISASLDESELSNKFPSRLYEMEATPPANSWQTIANSLSEGNPDTKVIPIRHRIAGFWKYAAAAIILVIAGWMIVQWTGNTNSEGESTLVVRPDSSQNEGPDLAKTIPVQQQPVTNDEEIIKEATALSARKTSSSAEKPVRTNRNVANIGKTASTAEEPVYASYEPENVTDRYVLLLTPTGNIIRMSKKLGDMVCCVSGEEQDNDCRDQIKKWQEKLATSNSTTTGGFIDVLSLVSALDNDL